MLRRAGVACLQAVLLEITGWGWLMTHLERVAGLPVSQRRVEARRRTFPELRATPAVAYINISTETENCRSALRSRRETSVAHNWSLTSVTDPVSSSPIAQKR